MRILIADDEPGTRTVVRRILMRHFSCEVGEVDNGMDALERLGAAPHALLLLDVKMPALNGIETLRAIRGHASTSALPVVMMWTRTGSRSARVVPRLRRASTASGTRRRVCPEASRGTRRYSRSGRASPFHMA